MSECVVRMEMPENCFECPFSIIDDTADGAWCNALANQVYGYAERDEDCPILCQLPEGHGRLVDADEIQREMYHGAFETDTDMQKWDSGCWIRYKMFENTIGDVPTIVPAETERSET